MKIISGKLKLAAGAGVTVLPRIVVDPQASEISFLPVADPLARRRIDILRRAHTRLSPAAHAFEAMIRDVASKTAGTG